MSALQPSYALTLELNQEDRNRDDKADILEINGLAESAEFVLRGDRPPAEALLPTLRLLNLSGAPLRRVRFVKFRAGWQVAAAGLLFGCLDVIFSAGGLDGHGVAAASGMQVEQAPLDT
jgi:hypothetical protein